MHAHQTFPFFSNIIIRQREKERKKKERKKERKKELLYVKYEYIYSKSHGESFIGEVCQ
jgi:hypothetical protein